MSYENDDAAALAHRLALMEDRLAIVERGSADAYRLGGVGQPWTVIGAGGAPAFQNSWVNYGNTYGTARYRKDVRGFVHLSGLVQGGATGTVIFTLPAGFRPLDRQSFVAGQGNQVAELVVETSGNVRLNNSKGAATSFTTLNSVVFPTVFVPADWHEIRYLDNSSYWTANARPGLYARDDGWCYVQGAYAGHITTGGALHTLGDYAPERTEIWPAVTSGLIGARLDAVGNGISKRMLYSSGYGVGSVWAVINAWWMAQRTRYTWTTPSLLNSWVNYDPGFYSPARFTKDDYGVVHVQGVVKGGTAVAGTDIFILPAGYRPAERLLFSTQGNATELARTDVLPTGEVEFQVGANGWFSLAPIMFLAEQ